MVTSTKRNSLIQKCCPWSPCRGIFYSSHLLSPQSQHPLSWSSGHLWRKSFRSRLCCTPSSHLQALPENLPSWILRWFILMVVMISYNPPLALTCSASLLLIPPPLPPVASFLILLLHGALWTPNVLLPALYMFLGLFLPCLANSPSCLWWWSCSPKPSAFVILQPVPRCLSRVQLAHRGWFSTEIAVQ